MIEIAIGIGIVLSLILTETVGVTAGGVIVPGYIALYLHDPIRVIATFFVSILVFVIIWFLSKYIMIYGKRRLVLCLLLGFLLGYLSKIYFRFPASNLDISVILDLEDSAQDLFSKKNTELLKKACRKGLLYISKIKIKMENTMVY